MAGNVEVARLAACGDPSGLPSLVRTGIAHNHEEIWDECPSRVRRDASRFDAAEPVQTPRAAFASGAGRLLQHLQCTAPVDVVNAARLILFSPATLGSAIQSGTVKTSGRCTLEAPDKETSKASSALLGVDYYKPH